MPKTKNKSNGKPRELILHFLVFILLIFKALSQIKAPNRYKTAYLDIIEKKQRPK